MIGGLGTGGARTRAVFPAARGSDTRGGRSLRERRWRDKPVAMPAEYASGALTRVCRVATLGDAFGFSAARGSDTSGERSRWERLWRDKPVLTSGDDGQDCWWRTHSCVPCWHSCRHSTFLRSRGVATLGDAARRSACATSVPTWMRRLAAGFVESSVAVRRCVWAKSDLGVSNALERRLERVLPRHARVPWAGFGAVVLAAVFLSGCNEKVQADPKAEAPPEAVVERAPDSNVVKVDHPELFKVATAIAYNAAVELSATGVVSADVARTVPVISLSSGRIIEVFARLGDSVKKGQLLMKVQSADIASAYSDYQQAMADETLARSQYERAKLLYDKGAIAQKDVEVSQDADAKAQVTVRTTRERLHILGADPEHPSAIVEVRAPVSGVITDQQVTAAAGTQGLASPNPFTISDLSAVWVLCDVYENDLSQLRMGEFADVRLNAYPDRVFKGRVANISPVLDQNLRTAKVRLELSNPGIMRLGMFVTATFHGQRPEMHAAVPATSVLHLHDRDFVYVPVEAARFRRVEVAGGKMLEGNLQEIKSGLAAGAQVVANALVLQSTVEQ